jgi:Sushi repeat (SCR repeat)
MPISASSFDDFTWLNSGIFTSKWFLTWTGCDACWCFNYIDQWICWKIYSARSCPDLTVANASVINKNTTYGSVVSVICDSGYGIDDETSETTTTCQANETWSNDVVCHRESSLLHIHTISENRLKQYYLVYFLAVETDRATYISFMWCIVRCKFLRKSCIRLYEFDRSLTRVLMSQLQSSDWK